MISVDFSVISVDIYIYHFPLHQIVVSGLQLRLVAGPVLADVAAPQPQLHHGPGLHQAVAQQHHRGHEQLVNIPVKRVVRNETFACHSITIYA